MGCLVVLILGIFALYVSFLAFALIWGWYVTSQLIEMGYYNDEEEPNDQEA